MSKPEIIILGAGGHAHACIDVIEQQGLYEIAGLVGLKDEIDSTYFGYSVIAEDDDLPQLAKEYNYAFIGIGQIKSSKNRILHFQKATELGFQLPSIISPIANVSRSAIIGKGTIVMHGVIINTGAKVGDNSIINTRAVLEHGVIVEDHSHISTGVIINGDVNVGSGSFIGSGSIIKEDVSIGKDCLIGMGISVRHDQADNTRFVGNTKV